MSGHPLRRTIVAELLKLADEAGIEAGETSETEAEMAASEPARILAFVSAHVASGGTLLSLAAHLSTRLDRPIQRQTLSKVVNKLPGAPEALAAARIDSADSLVETALDIVDKADISSREAFGRDLKRAETRQWIAERAAPSRWGGSKNVSVSVAFTALHLDALRKAPRLVAPAVAQLVAEIPEAEVVDTDFAVEE